MGILPLFPLPVVLFPGVGMPLHIFEPRYRQMVADVLEGDRKFGLIYHDPDESGPFLNEKEQVGTVAFIEKHQPLPDGRSLLLVRGLERFSILEEVPPGQTPYYQARVSPLVDEVEEDQEALRRRRERSIDLVKRVLETLPHVPDALPSFPTEEELSFKLAAMARLDSIVQQELLETTSEIARLEVLDPVFRYEMGRRRDWGGEEA